MKYLLPLIIVLSLSTISVADCTNRRTPLRNLVSRVVQVRPVRTFVRDVRPVRTFVRNAKPVRRILHAVRPRNVVARLRPSC